MKEFVKSITSPYEKELIETRRYLHRHPELSFQDQALDLAGDLVVDRDLSSIANDDIHGAPLSCCIY